MPRLTDNQYLKNHRELVATYRDEELTVATLEPLEQWDLDRYYLIAKQLPDEELLAHCASVTKEHQSLPHKAGRALAKLERNIQRATEAAGGDPVRFRHALGWMASGPITPAPWEAPNPGRPIFRTQPDFDLLAKAIVDFVIEQDRKERETKTDRS